MQAAGGEGPGDRTRLETTSSQTVGPYLHIGLTWLVTDDLVGPGTSGEPVVIEGRITDADGTRDLPLEPGFKGFGRVPTDASGAFRLRTVKPGPVPAADGSMQAPHV